MSEYSGDEYNLADRDLNGPPRKKRQNHNELERRRRHHQRDILFQLRDAIPSLQTVKPSSVLIMQKAKEYIDTLHHILRSLEVENTTLRQHLAVTTKQPIPPRPPVLNEIANGFPIQIERMPVLDPMVGGGGPHQATPIAPRPPPSAIFPPSPGYYPPLTPAGGVPPGAKGGIGGGAAPVTLYPMAPHSPGVAPGVGPGGVYALSPLSPQPYDQSQPLAVSNVESMSLSPPVAPPTLSPVPVEGPCDLEQVQSAVELMPPPPSPSRPEFAQPPLTISSSTEVTQLQEQNLALQQKIQELENKLTDKPTTASDWRDQLPPNPSLQDVALLFRKRKSVVDHEYGALQRGLADRRNSQHGTWESMKRQSQAVQEQIREETNGRYNFDKKPSLPTSRLIEMSDPVISESDQQYVSMNYPPSGYDL
ncbi:hypothetical protein H4R33_003735 [Dimargaris cristalligena]|nr:hypothetical protein H4R33_003735 [Dimargaris cristalligena]